MYFELLVHLDVAYYPLYFPGMNRIPFLIVIWLSFVSSVAGQQPAGTKFVLLNNGQVVNGDVEDSGPTVWVTKKTGSRLAFPQEKIEAIVDDLAAIYWAKYGLLDSGDKSGHVQLYQWCLKNGLIGEAKNQLDVAQVIAVDHRTLIEMQDQMTQQLEQRKLQKARESRQLVDLPDTKPVEPSNDKSATSDSKVQLVGYEKAAQQLHARVAHAKRLKTMTKNMPDRSVVMFKRKIEPILIRSCYTAKCHDTNANVLPLKIAGHGTAIPKRMSQENLFQVLKFTDINRPLESKVLAAAALPHAGAEKPILKIDSLQFHYLRAWLISISSQPYDWHDLPQTFLVSDLEVITASDESNATPELNTAKSPEKAPPAENFAPIPKQVGTKAKKTFEPTETTADPFDPKKFNQQYLRASDRIEIEDSKLTDDG